MKYLLFDTNIYLDMVVNRRKNINAQLISSFSALLQFGEVKIILPAIVKYETNKHLEAEIKKISQLIKEPIKKIDSLYWLTGLNGGTIDVNEYKKRAKQPLQELLDVFTLNQHNYILQLQESIKEIFDFSTTVFVEEDNVLLNNVTKRKIYKRAPLHKVEKESYADALILEVLINIRSYIHLQDEDVIYFVTGNSSDFSLDEAHKGILHPQIIEDLKDARLDGQVKYVNLFSKLVAVELADEITNAELKAQFEEELKSQYRDDYEDNQREAGGLPSLSSFQDMMEDRIRESDDVEKILLIFEEINNIYNNLYDISCYYDDTLLTWLNNIAIGKESIVIDAFNKFVGMFKITCVFITLDEIISWVEIQRDFLNYDGIDLPDYITVNEDVFITNANQEKVVLIWDDTELFPESGEQHTAHCILNKDTDIIADGSIEVIYGFVETDTCGNIGDSCDWSIDIDFDHIITEIEKIKDELTALKVLHEDYTCDIDSDILTLKL